MKIDLLVGPAIPMADILRQADHARGLGLPSPRPRSGPLAVVGGGQSAHAYVETLRRWNGDVIAVNGAWKWCRDRGIKATFYTGDPQQMTVAFAEGSDAILPPWAHPDIWDVVKSAELVDFVSHFSSSAPNVAAFAFDLGYSDVTFFGCDCSFSDDTHTYQNVNNPARMVVRTGKMDFMTTPAYFTQAQEIAALCRGFPEVIREMGGGLSHALTMDDDYDVVWMSPEVQSLFGAPSLVQLNIGGNL